MTVTTTPSLALPIDSRAASLLSSILNERDCQREFWKITSDRAVSTKDFAEATALFRKADGHRRTAAMCEIALADLFGIELPTLDLSRSWVATTEAGPEEWHLCRLIDKVRAIASQPALKEAA